MKGRRTKGEVHVVSEVHGATENGSSLPQLENVRRTVHVWVQKSIGIPRVVIMQKVLRKVKTEIAVRSGIERQRSAGKCRSQTR